MRNLGLMCLDGRGGMAKDEVQGVSWFRKAAEKDDESAENYLGLMYEKGRGGLPQDVTQAMYWYRKAADKGYASAQNNLAVLYLSHNPDLRNPRAALDYAQKAVARSRTTRSSCPRWPQPTTRRDSSRMRSRRRHGSSRWFQATKKTNTPRD